MSAMSLLILMTLLPMQATEQQVVDQQTVKFDPHLAAAAKSLAEVIAGEDKGAKIIAIRTLDAMGEHARPAIPALIQCVRDNFRDDDALSANFAAIHVLAKFGAESRAINPILVKLLSQPGAWLMPDVQARAALVAIGPDADTVPLLLDIVRNGSAEARGHAIDVLGQYGETAQAAVPVLALLLDDVDCTDRVRLSVVRALVRINSSGVAAVARKYRNTDDRKTRMLVISAVTAVGTEARAVDTNLEDFLQSAASDEELPPALVNRLRESLRNNRAAKEGAKSQARQEKSTGPSR